MLADEKGEGTGMRCGAGPRFILHDTWWPASRYAAVVRTIRLRFACRWPPPTCDSATPLKEDVGITRRGCGLTPEPRTCRSDRFHAGREWSRFLADCLS